MTGFLLEIVPREAKRLFFFCEKGGEKGLDLENNTTATSIKGWRASPKWKPCMIIKF